jgi:nucleoside-diphosphate-sugar epimerase
MTVLVTGASGFVGQALCDELARRGHNFRAGLRSDTGQFERDRSVVTGPINADTNWTTALAGVSTVLHLAARVHVMREVSLDPLAEFREVNTVGTLNLARQAARAGVKRLVFASSVKVNGEYTLPKNLFRESDFPAPQNPYAISKHEAEVGLKKIALETGLEITIIRPPLIYGPGVQANFLALIRAVRRGWPLPFGAINNSRSLVGIDNLIDFILLCSTHPQAVNQTFMVSDGHDVSTPELIDRLAEAMQVSPRLLRVPAWGLQAAGSVLGKKEAVARLCSSLQVDISHARRLLGWVIPVSLDTGLQRAVAVMDKP